MVVRQTKRRQYFVERFVWQSQTEEKTTHNSVRVLRGRVTDEKKQTRFCGAFNVAGTRFKETRATNSRFCGEFCVVEPD